MTSISVEGSWQCYTFFDIKTACGWFNEYVPRYHSRSPIHTPKLTMNFEKMYIPVKVREANPNSTHYTYALYPPTRAAYIEAMTDDKRKRLAIINSSFEFA